MRQMIECGRSQPSVATQPSSFLEKHRRPYFGREPLREEKRADDLRGLERGPRRLHARWVPAGFVPVGSSCMSWVLVLYGDTGVGLSNSRSVNGVINR